MRPFVPFEKLEIIRAEGRAELDPQTMREANALTSRAFDAPVPLEETYEHFRSANLRCFIYLSDRGERRLVAYSLNEISELRAGARHKIINCFTSAFLQPELRSGWAL